MMNDMPCCNEAVIPVEEIAETITDAISPKITLKQVENGVIIEVEDVNGKTSTLVKSDAAIQAAERAAESEENAKEAEANARGSAGEAANSATAAARSAEAASASASAAEDSATAAQKSAENAKQSESNVKNAIVTNGYANLSIGADGHLYLYRTTKAQECIDFNIRDHKNLMVTLT